MRRARTQAREAVLKALYQLDLRPDLTPEDVDDVLVGEARLGDSLGFARELLVGVRKNVDAIDQEVEQVAHNWKLRRMAVIDRNVIRLAAFEIIHRPDIPAPVTINEAVTIAKKYSTKDSGSFVNGILDKVYQRHRSPEQAPADLEPEPAPEADLEPQPAAAEEPEPTA
ncbi:transcription antitermination factor NusB [Planctomycetota bacterium]|nr:transcription antitermination factor NusB [Planctomycetota bacterium]